MKHEWANQLPFERTADYFVCMKCGRIRNANNWLADCPGRVQIGCRDDPARDKELADKLCAAITKRTGLRGRELVCPNEKSDMTPCVARDGSCAETNDGHCVGCGASVIDLWEQEVSRLADPTPAEQVEPRPDIDWEMDRKEPS